MMKSILNKVSSRIDIVFDSLFEKGSTVIGSEVLKIRGDFFSKEIKGDGTEKDVFNYLSYSKRLRLFYHEEAEELCTSLQADFFEELIARRRELKNHNGYFSSVGISVLTGFFVGLFVNNINKFDYIFNNTGSLSDVLKTVFSIIVFILGFILIFLALRIIFKAFITQLPTVSYAEEYEIKLIEDVIKERLAEEHILTE